MTSTPRFVATARRAVLVALLVLAALFGATAGTAAPAGAEPRPAVPAAPDPDLTEAEAAAPHRADRRHRRALRPRPAALRPGRRPAAAPPAAPPLLSARPAVRAVRCVVLRC
ncbi:hypothetical protein [Streptomyces lavendofoliae]|uniref:hypothetical protein n=1 Tax=Streptomyces lavendofoliae TaxID=67314 RepID=UPI00300F1999